jgi:hypothetical protein
MASHIIHILLFLGSNSFKLITLYHSHLFQLSTSDTVAYIRSIAILRGNHLAPNHSQIFVFLFNSVSWSCKFLSSSTQFYTFTLCNESLEGKRHLKQFITVELAVPRLARVMFSYWYLVGRRKEL